MKVLVPKSVERAIRTLDEEERPKVWSWFDRLENWENDELIRKMAKAMTYQGTYDLNTPDDLRIFFTLNEAKGEIAIVDLAKPSRFKVARAASE